ncbi:MAG: PEP-CTERM sorting domain-containing protein [Pseudomonadota bacterium]
MNAFMRQLCCTFACAASLHAAAATAYDNGPPDQANGNNMGFAWQADDFTLAVAATLGSVRFWSLEVSGTYRGAISWSILKDAAGTPGSVIASGTQGAVARSAVGSALGLSEFQNDFMLNLPLALGSGHYWLMLHNGAPSNLGDPNEFLWEATYANASVRGMESFDQGASWSGNLEEHAFQLAPVPEPAHYAMLGAGLLLLLSRRRAPALLLAAVCGAAPAQTAFPVNEQVHDTSASLTTMAAGTALPRQSRRILPLHLVKPAMKTAHAPGALHLQGEAPFSPLAAGVPTPLLPHVNTNGTPINMEGIAENEGAPSDANGAAGDTQYVQWVNTELAVFRKSDGALLLGPIAGNAVFSGFTGSPGADACRTTNFGDPIAQFDKLAHRWILTQFAWTNDASGPYYQCIAVSTSADATATYNRYVFEVRTATGAIAFNDYPKLGVWPDAYYLTYVLFHNTSGGYLGPQACALDRAAMLAGAAAGGRCADFGTAFGPILPSDLDGSTAPPAGSPNFLLSLDYDANGHGEHLFLWRFSFSANTISGAITIPVAPFTIGCPGTYGGLCIAQPAPGEALDALADRLMYRNAYRNYGNREVLAANHTVQQPGAPTDGPVGVRWYELRNPNGAVAVYQQGTHAPDATSRWMASVAFDKVGNMAMGYSVAGPSTAPGIRYTGRLRSEPLGRLETEAVIVNGSGVQINTFNRWGDYSAISVDPADDCTFWYTQQYIATTGTFNWRTRIANFTFNNCH